MKVADLLLLELTETPEEKLKKLFGADSVVRNKDISTVVSNPRRVVSFNLRVSKPESAHSIYINKMTLHDPNTATYNVLLNGINYAVIRTSYINEKLKNSKIYKYALHQYQQDTKLSGE
jgi:hypothetical protein